MSLLFDGIAFTVIFLIAFLLRWKAKGQVLRDVALTFIFIAVEIPFAALASYISSNERGVYYDPIRSLGRLVELIGVIWYVYRLLRNGSSNPHPQQDYE